MRIFRKAKENKGVCGGLLLYATQTSPQFEKTIYGWKREIFTELNMNISMKDSIKKFTAPRIMGVVGASDNPEKFGYLAYRELKKRGYTLYPVNTARTTIDGDTCFHSVHDLPPEVVHLLIVLPPESTKNLIREIDPSVIKMVWMQNGAESMEAVDMCRKKEIEAVYRQCILMHASPVRSYHLLHRWWWMASPKKYN